jgi:predicted ATPase
MDRYIYRLSHLKLNEGTVLVPGNLTIIVGPNNAGKSRFLKDIVHKTTQNPKIPGIIVTEAQWSIPPSLDALRKIADVERFRNNENRWVFRTLRPDLCAGHSVSGGGEWPDDYSHIKWTSDDSSQQHFVDTFGNALVANLTTEHRLSLVRENDSSTDARDTSNLLQVLYTSGRETELIIRHAIRDSFGKEVALDFTNLRKLMIRVAEEFNDLPSDPRDARPILLRKEKLDEQGDGIRSFVGIVTALTAVRRSLFLIDEPEAFLHPPQAFRIGAILAESATDARQIILATHSVEVLRGILSKTQDLTIVRLDRDHDTSSVNVLDASQIRAIANDALLASARVLDGIFYAGAVIVEGDRDARLYQFVSRMLRSDLDLHFVNTDGKQLVPRVAEIYRGFGVRSVGIVDFDVLNNADEFSAHLEAFGVDDKSRQSAMSLRTAVAGAVTKVAPDRRLAELREELANIEKEIEDVSSTKFESDQVASSAKNRVLEKFSKSVNRFNDRSKAWRSVKERGRANLEETGQKAFDSLYAICAEHGLFINPCGELESLMEMHGLDHSADKPSWYERAMKMLPRMKADRTVYPWKLLEQVHNYLTRPGPSQTTSQAE